MELLLPVTAATALYAAYHFAGLPVFLIVGVVAILAAKAWGDAGARR